MPPCYQDEKVTGEFEGRPTFDGYMDLKAYLEGLLGTGVDLVTEQALKPPMLPIIEKDLVHIAQLALLPRRHCGLDQGGGVAGCDCARVFRHGPLRFLGCRPNRGAGHSAIGGKTLAMLQKEPE